LAAGGSDDRLGWELRCLEEIQRGNRRAFGELYAAFAPPLYAQVLLPRLGSAWAAEEALAETFRAALEHLGGYRPQGGSLFGWLARIAVNKATDLHRERARTGKALASFESLVAPLREGECGSAGEAEQRLDQRRLRAAVDEALGRDGRIPRTALWRARARVWKKAMKVAPLVLLATAIAGCGAAARWVDDAAGAHAQADALARGGQPDAAARVLVELVSRPVPAQVAAQDKRAVLQDAYARLADLALAERNAEQALRYADAGLALGEGRDLFSSALRTFRGRAHEALGRDAEAARDYEAAQIVAEALLRNALAGGGSR